MVINGTLADWVYTKLDMYPSNPYRPQMFAKAMYNIEAVRMEKAKRHLCKDAYVVQL
jgi:hypothetical protein